MNVNNTNGLLSFDNTDLYKLANQIDTLEVEFKNTVVRCLNSLDKNNVVTDITSIDIDGNYKTFDSLCGEILNTQTIVTKDKVVYVDHIGLLTSDTNETALLVQGAIADNMSVGTAAWVDGYYIEGNGKDNAYYYNLGYTDGLANQNTNANIVYTYHTHNDGYCTQIPVYHRHVGNTSSGGACYQTKNVCGGTIKRESAYNSSGHYDDNFICNRCGGWYDDDDEGDTCTKTLSYSLTCPKTAGVTVDSYYCNIQEGTIVKAEIEFF